MPEKGGTTRRTRVHARDKDFTLYERKRGLFTVLAPVGRYSDALLTTIAQGFLQKPGFLAVDLRKLDAVALPLLRVLAEWAGGFEAGTGRVVFVSPPDKIRALLKLVDREKRITLTASESDLEGDLHQVQARVDKGQERVLLVRSMLETNPCWQLADGEGRWLCPFCVTIRPAIRYVARGSATQLVVDRVAAHLGEECTTYTDGAVDGWPFEVLERVLTSTQLPSAPAGRPSAHAVPGAGSLGRPGGPDTRRRHLLPPKPPRIDGCEVAVHYRAAKSLSGDFFDFVRLPGRRAAIVVGDLSATGVDPAVLMGMARKVIRIRLTETPDLAEALGRVNDDLCEELEGESFVTAAVAIVDGPRRELKLARAGQAAPFLLRAGPPAQVERLELPGPLLGLVPTASFEDGIRVESLALASGDVLLLHTDGLEELRDAAGEMFGADRLASILRSCVGTGADFVLGAAILEAEQFGSGRERQQDMTAVCVRFL